MYVVGQDVACVLCRIVISKTATDSNLKKSLYNYGLNLNKLIKGLASYYGLIAVSSPDINCPLRFKKGLGKN